MHSLKLKLSVIALCRLRPRRRLRGQQPLDDQHGQCASTSTSNVRPRQQHLRPAVPYGIGIAGPGRHRRAQRPDRREHQHRRPRKTANADALPPGFGRGDPFGEFFRRYGTPHGQGERPVRGQGSASSSRPTARCSPTPRDRGAEEVTVKLTDRRGSAPR